MRGKLFRNRRIADAQVEIMSMNVQDYNSAQPMQVIEPIEWSNIWIWAHKTAIADRKKYQRQKRLMSVKRLWRMLIPNLRCPIFIIGSGRSGTTFLGSCLGELPEYSYHFEPVITKASARYIYEKQWSVESAMRFYRMTYSWLMRLHFDADLTFAEKTPRNSFIIPFLHKTFPDAKFVHIIRDGKDVALSLLKKPWYRADSEDLDLSEPGGYKYGPYARFWVEKERVHEFEATSDIHRCIWLWRRYIESILTNANYLPASQYYELRYEELVANPANEAKYLLDFLEISSMKSRNLFQKTIELRASLDSVGKWKFELSSEQLRKIEKEAGDWLNYLGYSNTP